jgi:hypothetical protein
MMIFFSIGMAKEKNGKQKKRLEAPRRPADSLEL